MSAVAEERPLLCLVDDAQWLDGVSAQGLLFVARRLLAESVAIVVAVREPSPRQDFDGLPDLRLRVLSLRWVDEVRPTTGSKAPAPAVPAPGSGAPLLKPIAPAL